MAIRRRQIIQVCALVLGVCVVHVSKCLLGDGGGGGWGGGQPQRNSTAISRSPEGICTLLGPRNGSNLVILAPISCDLLFASGDANQDTQTQDEKSVTGVDPSSLDAPGVCFRCCTLQAGYYTFQAGYCTF